MVYDGKEPMSLVLMLDGARVKVDEDELPYHTYSNDIQL